MLGMIGTAKGWSKENTNHKHLNNLRLALQQPDESSAFAEKSAKLERVFDVANSCTLETALCLAKSKGVGALCGSSYGDSSAGRELVIDIDLDSMCTDARGFAVLVRKGKQFAGASMRELFGSSMISGGN